MDLKEQLTHRAMTQCRHFNGIQHDECKVGVNYRALAGEPQLGMAQRLPCGIRLPNGKEPQPVHCDKRAVCTREEAEIQADAEIAMFERHGKAHRAVHDDAKAKKLGRGHGGLSECACPICSGTIRYSVAGYNGHIHAACSTSGCVQWME